jgi:hypothetical protein
VAISGEGNQVSSEIYSFTTIDTPAIENKKWELKQIGSLDEGFFDYSHFQDTLTTYVDVYDFFPKGNSATVKRWRPWGVGMVEEEISFSFSADVISFRGSDYKVLNFGRLTQNEPLFLTIERIFDSIMFLYEPVDL